MPKDSRKFKRPSTYLDSTGGTMTGDMVFGNDKKITFGDDTDLEIYHTATGNETHIDGKNSRPVYIRAKDLYLTNAAGDDKAIHVDGGAGEGAQTVVKLYHDDVEKFKTHASGFQFTGTPTEGLNNLGTLTGGGTVNIDLALGNVAMAYIDDAPVTFTFSGYDETVGNSNSFTLILVHGSTQQITWPAFTMWTDGDEPTLSATNDVLTFITTSGSLGANAVWLGFHSATAMAIPS